MLGAGNELHLILKDEIALLSIGHEDDPLNILTA